MKKTICFVFALSSLVLFNGCSKDVPEHTHENYGNSQISSTSYTVFNWEWTFLDPEYYVDLSVPEITQAVVDNGAVMVYYENTYGEWEAMPNTVAVTSNYSTVYSFSHWLGHVSLYVFDTDWLTLSPDDMNIKIVIISEKQLMQDASVDWTNYQDVMAKLNIESK
jgi:hypothetical protein